MELDTCAVIGRLTLPVRPRQTEGPSSYNMSRLGLTPSVTGEAAAAEPPVPRPPEESPVVVAELVSPPAPAPLPVRPACLRRKASFALPAELLDQVRARATATGAFQYAIVAEALHWFFREQVEALSPDQPTGRSLIACVRRVVGHVIGRSSPSR